MNHLAVYSRNRSRDYIEMMFAGEKTVDIKLSYRRIAPYKKVKSGDMLYIKESSGPVVGRVLISKVMDYEIVDSGEILAILLGIQKEVGLESEEAAYRMFEKVKDKKYVTVFWFEKPELLDFPVYIEKSDRRVWVADYQPSEGVLRAVGEWR